jgi:hypothetical protein
MSASSKSVHDALAALRDAANAAIVLGRAASMLSEVLNSVADLEARIVSLERAIIPPRAGEAQVGREGTGHAMICAETRSHVATNTAANLLGRAPQTLRKWACYDDGPLRPLRVNGRLAWSVADIRRLLKPG